MEGALSSSSTFLPLAHRNRHSAPSSLYPTSFVGLVAVAAAAVPPRLGIRVFKFKPPIPIFPVLSRASSPLFQGSVGTSYDATGRGEEEEQLQSEEEEFDADDGEEGPNEGPTSSSRKGSRLYVGNLPFSMTSSQLTQVFEEAGRVESVEVIYDRVTDRSRGFAFVTMGSVEEAKHAIRMFNGSQVGGRSIKVNFPEVPRGGEREVLGPKIRSGYQRFVDSPYKIYAGNLGWNVTSDTLREAFAAQVGLLGAKVVYDRSTARSKGFGFVSFASPEAAQAALESMDGMEVEGRPLRLNSAKERAPISASSDDTNGRAT